MTRLSKFALLGTAAVALAAIPQPLGARTVELEFDAGDFSDPLDIDNSFFPLVPGTTFVYKAETSDGCEVDVVTVTNDTRVVAGVTTRVVEDLAYEDEDCDGPEASELVEKTFDWYAQDDAGNIWYFGEQTFDCEGASNCTLGDGSWEAGVNGALPGIIMLANPQSGDRYRQEQAEGVAEDWGMVMNLNRSVRLQRDDAFPPGTFSGCLITKEWNDLEPGSVEQKTYCPNVGLVLIAEHSGKVVRFELTDDSSGAAAASALRFRTPPRRRR